VPATVRLPAMVAVPFTVKAAGLDALPKFTVGGGVKLGDSTSRVAWGLAVPMPTFAL
jgi:hypothetical protein